MKADEKEEIIEHLLQRQDCAEQYALYSSLDTDAAFGRFSRRVGLAASGTGSGRKHVWRWAVGLAASFVLVAGLLVARHQAGVRQQQATRAFMADVKPGEGKAWLATADGLQVQLTGEAASVDTLAALSAQAEDELSTVTVPRGGEYRLALSDGTVVHLNAESSLTFPSRFAGDARDVTLQGEAYFEVAHQADRPFIVHIYNNVSVRQYGTRFNIRSYAESPAEVTLVQGSIGVTVDGRGECILTPGRQASIAQGEVVISDADVETVTGWKDGVFRFDDEPLAEIAQALSRWYDVDIRVARGLGSLRFTGSLMRDEMLSDILDAIGDITGTTYSVRAGVVEIH